MDVERLLSVTTQVEDLINELDPDTVLCDACNQWVHKDKVKKTPMINSRSYLLICKDGCEAEEGKGINSSDYYSVIIR